MKKIFGLLIAALLLVLCVMPAAEAATVEYLAKNIGGDRWQYDYTIFNDSATDIGALALYFGYGLYDELDVLSAPSDWVAEFWDPELVMGLETPGEVVVFTSDMLLAPTESLTGLSVVFNWLGNGKPGFQAFDLLDLDSGLPLDGGTGLTVAAVPEPGTLSLFGVGLAGLVAYHRIRKAGKHQ